MKTDNELTEDQIIDVFMGLPAWREELIFTGGGYKKIRTVNIKYSSDWNALMGVVEKIEITPIQNPVFDEGSTCNPNFQIHKQIVKIWYPFENYKPFIYCAGTTKIEAVYKAVVEFIHFYNRNKK